jgi:hypothetical protein
MKRSELKQIIREVIEESVQNDLTKIIIDVKDDPRVIRPRSSSMTGEDLIKAFYGSNDVNLLDVKIVNEIEKGGLYELTIKKSDVQKFNTLMDRNIPVDWEVIENKISSDKTLDLLIK